MNHLQRFYNDVLHFEAEFKKTIEVERKILIKLADTNKVNCRVSKLTLKGLKKTKLELQKRCRHIPYRLKHSIKEVEKNIKVDQQKYDETIEEFDEIKRIQRELQDKIAVVQRQVAEIRSNLLEQDNFIDAIQQQGLTPARIQKFHHFAADESMVGDSCAICLDEIEVGRIMIRLDCKGQHVLCQKCVEGWLADNNTCPLCRHVFK